MLVRLPLSEERTVETLRILAAEDHPLFWKGMSSLPKAVPDFEVTDFGTDIRESGSARR